MNGEKKIIVQEDGPYVVYGNLPLVHKTQVVSEYGEPLTWQKGETIEIGGQPYELCRCGQSGNKPFCDGTHDIIGFEGAECADTSATATRQVIYAGGTRIIVKQDSSLCMSSGFCGNRIAHIREMVSHTNDTMVRSQVIAMIERCPSGSFTYAIEEGGPDIEPDLPEQVAVTTEITSDGPIAGPLWVTGNVPIVRADGQPLEVRNRVTLCNCGLSRIKPLCDGTHRTIKVQKADTA